MRRSEAGRHYIPSSRSAPRLFPSSTTTSEIFTEESSINLTLLSSLFSRAFLSLLLSDLAISYGSWLCQPSLYAARLLWVLWITPPTRIGRPSTRLVLNMPKGLENVSDDPSSQRTGGIHPGSYL